MSRPTSVSFPAQFREYYVDAKEAARFLSIHSRTLQQLPRADIVPAHPLGCGPRTFWRFLDAIMRQKDPSLKEALEQLAHGDVHIAIVNLDRQRRAQQIKSREERFQTIAQDYARDPHGTLVVAPRQSIPP